MKQYSILLIFVLMGLSQTALAEACYPFMPEKSTIQGTITQEMPPSTKEVEKPEPYYAMNLSAPICIMPGENDKMNKRGVRGISKIQLTFRGMKQEKFAKLKPHLDGEIKCNGAFFYRHMARHYTEVLMWTLECEPVPTTPL